MDKHPLPRTLLIFTAIILIALFVIGARIQCNKGGSAPVVIPHNGEPSLGNPEALVQVVVFEDPKCSSCRIYSLEIFPKLKEEFIDTNQIYYTLIPVNLEPGSEPILEALWCTYRPKDHTTYPTDFFNLMQHFYEQPVDQMEKLQNPQELEVTLNSYGMDEKTAPIISCVEKQHYRSRIKNDTDYARALMGGTLATPTIYINGMKLESLTYERLKNQIQYVLEQENGS